MLLDEARVVSRIRHPSVTSTIDAAPTPAPPTAAAPR
jgi:hypothetical protein